MLRRHLIAILIAAAAMLPLSAVADERVNAANALIESMIGDMEAFLATDTGDNAARTAEVDRLLTSYFDMDSITRASTGQYWRAANDEQKSEYGKLFREVLLGTVERNFDQIEGFAYNAGGAIPKGGKFIIVSGSFTDTTGARPEVTVNWRILTLAGKAPKVFDIEIENLSLLVTQKQENVAVIRKNKGDFQALIIAMRDRLENPIQNDN